MHYNFYLFMFQHYHARRLKHDWRNTQEELIVKQHEAYYAAIILNHAAKANDLSLLRA